ncbi:MAG: AAA family ATPase [Candidatus Staskawiczbacteria bacterium]|jgi:predicted ATP-dependent endonuclease of OLD family
MHITNLSIKNFRNFADFSIDLNSFTLIIGENNTGKTNLLESLCLLFGQEITMFRKRMLTMDDINYQSIKEFKEKVKNSEIDVESIIFPEVKIEAIMTDFNDDQASIVGDWFIDENLEKAKLTYIFSLRPGWQKKN